VGAFAQVQPAAPLAGQPSQAEPRSSAASCASCHQPAPDNRPAPLPGEALDEPRGGKTLGGTPVTQRIAECFPAEARDLFWQMDMVPDESQPGHPLRPLNFDQNGDGVIDDHERDAIRGRNTWVLWCAGNEGFWNWLSQNGYGITDFLILVDSRNRTNRFVQAGLINQPGFKSNADPAKTILGLYLDLPVGDSTANSDLPDGYVSHGPVLSPPPWEAAPTRPNAPGRQFDLFPVGDAELYSNVLTRLEAMGDGVDYTIYGFPSGVVGLRLFPNPDFFGVGPGPAAARVYWTNQVINQGDRYYRDTQISQDPKLVRPFRVGMSCGFCHVAPHPLNPPKDPEAPDWANLSTTIGNQYWNPRPAFADLLKTNDFLYHFLASQQPGTIDTSLVSSDQINNANTINSIFNVNARLARAELNPPEQQSADNLLVKSIESQTNLGNAEYRYTPRVLLDGADSIGVFGALARVYLNIGTFYEEWARCDNLVVGFKPQRAFRLDVCQHNSVYWQANERYRAGYLAAFFTAAYSGQAMGAAPNTNFYSQSSHASTQPMKLADAKAGDGQAESGAAKLALEMDPPEKRISGRLVWLNNCAICHSSIQPEGFQVTFSRPAQGETWQAEPAPTNSTYVLPMDATNWTAYKQSPSYQSYTNLLLKMVDNEGGLDGDPETNRIPFWQANYLSTDIRVPVTLTYTPSARAMASNGLTNHIWDNFSSVTYKELPAVGGIEYFDSVSRTNNSFQAPGGGRGYYRPASLVSLWATAPYLHNNALGAYFPDPSVKGRLVQFYDGIRRILWSSQRTNSTLVLSPAEWDWLAKVQADEKITGLHNVLIDSNLIVRRSGDLRGETQGAAASDPGFIYRLPNDTAIRFAPGFVRPLLDGLFAGPVVAQFLTRWFWFWLILAVISIGLAWMAKPRYLGLVFIAVAVLVALPLTVLQFGGTSSAISKVLMILAAFLPFTISGWIILGLALGVAGVLCIQAKPDGDASFRSVIVILLGGIGVALLVSRAIWVGVALLALAVVVTAWRPTRTPTLPGLSRIFFVFTTAVAILIGIALPQFVNGKALLGLIGPIPINVGPIPHGTPVNLIMNLDPDSPELPGALVSMTLAVAEIKHQGLTDQKAWDLFSARAGESLLKASKCPDFVVDRGHFFGEALDADPQKNEQDKEDLIAFLKTL